MQQKLSGHWQTTGIGHSSVAKPPTSHARASSNAGLDPRVARYLLIADLETHRAGGRPAGFADQLGVPLWRELGCDADAQSEARTRLPIRSTRAAGKHSIAVALGG